MYLCFQSTIKSYFNFKIKIAFEDYLPSKAIFPTLLLSKLNCIAILKSYILALVYKIHLFSLREILDQNKRNGEVLRNEFLL